VPGRLVGETYSPCQPTLHPRDPPCASER
jgi:hypothetical protein